MSNSLTHLISDENEPAFIKTSKFYDDEQFTKNQAIKK